MLDNIPRQKQVLQDIYNILSQIAVDVQPPENVSINTSNNIHTIQNFGYNLNPKHYGSYEYAISLKIGVDYNIKNLTATVLTAHIGNIFSKIIREVDENTNYTTQKDFSEFMSKVENSERMTAKEFEQFSQLKEENKRLSSDLDFERSKRKAKEQECEELKREIAFGNNGELSDKIRAIVFKDLNAENSKYKQALEDIERFMIFEFSGQNEWVKNNVLGIINKAKEE